MAYNSYFPTNYPFYGYATQPGAAQPQIPPQPNRQQGNAIIWVQGLAGAKSYLVAPGTTVMLMDSEESVFYIKSADQSGMPTLRAFDYKERAAEQPVPAQGVDMSAYVTREELEKKLAELSKGGAQ